jgi:peptide/nickel transport system permease protein
MDNRINTSGNAEKIYKKTSLFRETLDRLFQNKGAVIGLIYIIILVLVALSADFLYDYETEVIEQNIPQRVLWPSIAHPFGTDEFGRDMLARVVHGSRVSLTVASCAVMISVSVGGALGAIAGYFGKTVDNVIMRFTDILLSIPMTMFAIVIVAALGASTVNLILALGLASVPIFARVVRGAVLTVRDSDYVEAARAIGAPHAVIILKHILPNCFGPIIVQMTLRMASSVYNTAALSFLGMGVSAPAPEWGALLASGRNYIRDYSYLCLIPGTIIMLTILSLNMLGDGLRDALDPRLR